MKSDLIEKQIQGMPPHRLAYLCGMLSHGLGMSRTATALNIVNSLPDAELTANTFEYFRRFVCILGTVVSDDQWKSALQATQRVMPRQAKQEVH
jgi:hypothetical protein